jgi:hypothetical protein
VSDAINPGSVEARHRMTNHRYFDLSPNTAHHITIPHKSGTASKVTVEADEDGMMAVTIDANATLPYKLTEHKL